MSTTKSVVKLNNSNFKYVAHDFQKHALVKYFSHKCYACSPVSDMFRNVARDHGASECLVFAEMDITTSACPGNVYVPSIPHIELYKQRSNQVVVFPGPYTENTLQEFIKKHTGYGSNSDTIIQQQLEANTQKTPLEL